MIKCVSLIMQFSDFNMEQQADIIMHYYGDKSMMGNQTVQKLLIDFQVAPRNTKLLPNTTDFE